MLNKNQSNKWNSWKYLFVLPLLGAFLFFFQIKVVAQEKALVQSEIIPNRLNLIELLITKNTTDNEIKEFCKQLKKMYNIDLSFFNIKRNSNSEIISIEGKDKDIHGSGSYIQSDNTPIKPFKFFYDVSKKEMGYFNMDLNTLSKGKVIIINGNVSSQEDLDKLGPNEIKSIAVNTKTDKPTIEIDTKNTFKPVKITDKDIYIDGVKSTNEEFSKLDQSTVDKVDVNTFENTVRITTKTIKPSSDNIDVPTPPAPPIPPLPPVEKKETRQDKVVNGWKVSAIPANEKKETSQEKVVNGWKVSAIPATRNLKEMLVDDKNIDYKKAVIIINGKLSNSKQLNKLNPDEIARISVQKTSDGKQKEAMIQKYGEKALNGIIEIETKGYSEN